MPKFDSIIQATAGGTVSAPAIAIIGDLTSGLYQPSSGQIALTAGGVAGIKLTATAATFPLASTFNGAVSTTAGLTATTGGITLTAGGLSIAASNTISMGGNVVNNVATPLVGTDGANKAYVDASAEGLDVHASCVVATTGSETYTIASGSVTQISGTTIDGQAVATGARVLIKDAPSASGTGSAFSSQPGNGIYVATVAANISLARATDMSGTNGAAGVFSFVETGTANAGSGYVVTTPSGSTGTTYGTTAIQWTQFSGAGSISVTAPITKTGNTIGLTTPLAVSYGGLGAAPSLANGTLLVASSSTVVGGLANGTSGYPLLAGVSTPAYGQLNIASGTNVTGALAVTNGGTGVTSLSAITTELNAGTVYTYSWSPNGSATSVTFTPTSSPLTAGIWGVTVINTTTSTAYVIEYADVAINSSTGAITVTWTTAPANTTTYKIQCVG